MKNFKTKLFAAAMAAPLAMSGMSVFAEGEGEASITVTKELTAPKGAEKLNATFTMTGTLTKINEQDATKAEIDSTPNFSWTFNASKDSVTEKSESATATTVTYTATSDNLLDNKTYTHAGVYTYEFKENQSLSQGETLDPTKETVTFDDNKFTVNVYVVENADGNYEVKAATQSSDTGKATAMTFANTYTRKGSSDPDAEDFDGLVIANTVEGDLADKTKDFKYTLNLTDANSDVTPIVKKGETVINPENNVYTFTLKHGESVTVSGVSTGSSYSVSQNEVKPYVTTAGYTFAPVEGGAISTPTIDDNARSVTGNVTAKKDIVTYKNTYNNENIPTGNIINNMPFLGLIAVALGGFIAYIALKRRQNA